MQAYPGTALPKGESLRVCWPLESPHLPSYGPSPTPPLLGLPQQHFPHLHSNSLWFQGYNFIQSNRLPKRRRPSAKDALAKRLLLKVEPVPLSPQACSYIMSCRVRQRQLLDWGGGGGGEQKAGPATSTHWPVCRGPTLRLAAPVPERAPSPPHLVHSPLNQAARGSHEQQGFLAASKQGPRGWHPREQRSSSF